MNEETTRRAFLRGGTLATAGALAAGAAEPVRGAQEPPKPDKDFPRDRPGPGGPVGSPTDRGKLVPGRRGPGEKPVPVENPDLTKLFWEMKGGVKEFHLHCRHTRREFLPDMWFDVWGFNDSMPGPTIEATEGDRVRIVVHNDLPESTSIHWHGLEVPIAMDGVHGLTQEPIKPGKTFVYEFDLHQNGTFFYHSHGPMQEGMGMAGLFIIHPKAAYSPPVDHDFALLIQEWAILPQSTVPNTMSMEFNFFTINGRSGPYTTPLVVKLGSRVRIRFVNMSPIDHHPMHLHGHTFWITGTEAGRIPESAWIPSNNVLVGVAQARDIEFIANNPGDWMIHCHMFHHMMNHMTSMVGPMAGHAGMRTPGSRDMANSLGMLTLGRGGPFTGELGPTSQGRGTGEQTSDERAVRNGNGMGGRAKDPGYKVPGYPQDMMDMHGMHPPEHVKKINKPETRGMRRNWFAGVEALMTVLRVLPPDLYDRVVTGKGEVEPGASTPGAGPGEMPGGHEMPKKDGLDHKH
jgi:FtsP/CotA-like multicopper oxidase with cupredoxin domain